MSIVYWVCAFILGGLAQTLIMNGKGFWGGLLYGIAGCLSYVILFYRKEDSSQEPSALDNSAARIHHDLALIPLFVGLVLVVLTFGLVWTASLPGSKHTVRLTLGLGLWIGFLILILFSIRKPFIEFFKRETRRSLAPLGILLLITLFLGIYRLTEVPITVHGDEGMVGIYARKILTGEIETLFSTSWYAIPQFFFLIPASTMFLFGDHLFGFRMSTVILGILSVIPCYFLLRRIWGEAAAIFGSLLLITNHWFIHLMHCAVQYGQASFFAAALLALWFALNRKRSTALCVASGMILGFALLSYQANHILPFLWIASQLWLLMLRKIPLRWFAVSILWVTLTAGGLVSPWLAHDFARAGITEAFSSRAESVVIWSRANRAHLKSVYKVGNDESRIWAAQAQKAFLSPILYSDSSIQYDGRAPFLDRLVGVLFVFGVLVTAFRFFDPSWSVPAGWILGILFIGGACTIDPPFFPRLAGCTTVLFYLAAGIISRVLQLGNERKFQTIVLLVFFSFLTLISAGINLQHYFGYYAREVSPHSIHFTQTQAAYWVKERGPKSYTYLFSGPHFSFFSGTVQFLAKDCKGEEITQLPDVLKSPPFAVIVDETQALKIPLIKGRLSDYSERNYTLPSGERLFTFFTIDEKP